jgi:hypothetical protein
VTKGAAAGLGARGMKPPRLLLWAPAACSGLSLGTGCTWPTSVTPAPCLAIEWSAAVWPSPTAAVHRAQRGVRGGAIAALNPVRGV